jgi:hypothetical protein
MWTVFTTESVTKLRRKLTNVTKRRSRRSFVTSERRQTRLFRL